jgi:hypothetical protein
VLGAVVGILEQKLGLKVHPEKTKIVDNREEPFTVCFQAKLDGALG